MNKTKIVVLSEDELEALIERAVGKSLSKRESFTRKWLNQQEAGEYVGYDRTTLNERTRAGILPVYRDGRSVRYLISDLDNLFLNES